MKNSTTAAFPDLMENEPHFEGFSSIPMDWLYEFIWLTRRCCDYPFTIDHDTIGLIFYYEVYYWLKSENENYWAHRVSLDHTPLKRACVQLEQFCHDFRLCEIVKTFEVFLQFLWKIILFECVVYEIM